MGYLHIQNVYRCQDILMFKECYALEKIHGTSAHISWNEGQVRFFSGGESYVNFVKLFNVDALTKSFNNLGHKNVIVFGEAYGGKQQNQSLRYGKDLKFVGFDVKIDDRWVDVLNAYNIVTEKLNLEFVHFKRINADVSSLDAERDAPSEQARRNGIIGDQPREGVVLRPLHEMFMNGERIISKHKRPEERETKTDRKIIDPAKLIVLEEADAIAEEWVTQTRLEHVLDKLQNVGIHDMPKIITAMIEDVIREADKEIVDSREARKAISSATSKLFKKHLQNMLR